MSLVRRYWQLEVFQNDLASKVKMPSLRKSPGKSVKEHGYAIGASPRKLRAENYALQQKLRARIAQLRNAEKRENRLRGNLSKVLDRLNKLHLLNSHSALSLRRQVEQMRGHTIFVHCILTKWKSRSSLTVIVILGRCMDFVTSERVRINFSG